MSCSGVGVRFGEAELFLISSARVGAPAGVSLQLTPRLQRPEGVLVDGAVRRAAERHVVHTVRVSAVAPECIRA